jgi:hypothetical protein
MTDMGFLPQVTALLDQVRSEPVSGCCSRPPWTATSTC